MLAVAAKTYLMVAVCFFFFICNPMGFPFVLATGFAIYCTPYAIGALRGRGR